MAQELAQRALLDFGSCFVPGTTSSDYGSVDGSTSIHIKLVKYTMNLIMEMIRRPLIMNAIQFPTIEAITRELFVRFHDPRLKYVLPLITFLLSSIFSCNFPASSSFSNFRVVPERDALMKALSQITMKLLESMDRTAGFQMLITFLIRSSDAGSVLLLIGILILSFPNSFFTFVHFVVTQGSVYCLLILQLVILLLSRTW